MHPHKECTTRLLITGCYRSGTEYLTLLLNNHPDLALSMYIVSFMRFCIDQYDPLDEDGNHIKLLYDTAWRVRYRWKRNLDVDAVLKDMEGREPSYAALYDAIMQQLFLGEEQKGWGEKTQLVWRCIPRFLEMYPDTGRVVHVVRDPRNVLASWKRYTYAAPPSYLGSVFNAFDSMRLGLEYQQRFSSACYRLVRFEDLLSSPEEVLEDLFHFLGRPPRHDLLDETGWVDAHGDPWVHNSVFHNREGASSQFDPQASLVRWQQLPATDLALCEAVCSSVMEPLGYEPSHPNAPWPDVLRPLMASAQLETFLRNWLLHGEGAQDFPTDPTQPGNWEENKTAAD